MTYVKKCIENQIKNTKVKLVDFPDLNELSIELLYSDELLVFTSEESFENFLKKKNLTSFNIVKNILIRKEIYDIMEQLVGDEIKYGELYLCKGRKRRDKKAEFSKENINVVKVRRVKKITEFTDQIENKKKLKYVETEKVIIAIYIPKKYIQEEII